LVLAVQDTTEVDWTAHPATKGLGPLGPRACQGLLVHSQGHSVFDGAIDRIDQRSHKAF
jgi:hypothetical protein